MENNKIYLYPLWIRLWHGINALLCLLLILTGISMQYSDPDYPLIRFDIAVWTHNAAGILLSLAYLLFIVGNVFGCNGKYYICKPKGLLRKMYLQFRYYAYGFFKGEKAPFPITKEHKFNPLQQISYMLIMYIIFPVIIISGWFLVYPEFILHNILGGKALHYTDLLHAITGFIVSIFLLIHVYLCTMGATVFSDFKTMINGWYEKH